jgi:hypothetical protein
MSVIMPFAQKRRRASLNLKTSKGTGEENSNSGFLIEAA